MLREFLIVAGLVLAIATVQPVSADNWRMAQNQSTEEQGKVPLSRIVKDLKRRNGGEPASIKFQNGTYRILWRDRNGDLHRFRADADTGRIRKGN